MAVIGLIPARGGSKGIPSKNIAPCAGRPLLAYTCEAARASHMLDRVILSTDSDRIAEVGRAYGAEVPFMRPAALADDAAPALPVMLHALEWLESGGVSAEAIVLLQPTSPLRRAKHIDEAVELFRSTQADSVVSVVEVPHRYHPDSVMREEAGGLVPYRRGVHTVTSRHDLKPLYARNGPAVLVASRATLRSGQLYGMRTIGYQMSEADSLDVDTPWDLHLAELLLRGRTDPRG
jgi:CMP-N-acetylneuraminic acid synthetase